MGKCELEVAGWESEGERKQGGNVWVGGRRVEKCDLEVAGWESEGER